MKTKTIVLIVGSHIFAALIGFALGIYMLPILTAPPAPSLSEVNETSSQAQYTATFKRDLEGSDALHWGEGEVSISSSFITLTGKLSPGPDYRLYLSPSFVETEEEFNKIKSSMIQVGNVKTFENFIVPLSTDIAPSRFNTVIVWCESFGEFITSARYQ